MCNLNFKISKHCWTETCSWDFFLILNFKAKFKTFPLQQASPQIHVCMSGSCENGVWWSTNFLLHRKTCCDCVSWYLGESTQCTKIGNWEYHRHCTDFIHSLKRQMHQRLEKERPFHKSIFARLDHIKMCVLVYWLLALQKDLCYVRALYYYYHRLPKVFTSTFCNSPPNRWSQLTCAWPSSMAERRPGLVSSTSRNGWPSLWLKQYWKTSNTQNTGVTTATVSFVHSVPLHLVITQLYKKI